MNLVTWLARAARADPGRVAIYSGSRPWVTYGELALRVAILAGGLASRMGLEPGARVAIAMKNSPEYLVAMYAAWWAPEEYRFVERLPKNNYGKVVKTELRAALDHD